MKTYLKALGLALVAALAMSAVAASAAQAENATFTAEEYPAVAKGEQEAEQENYFEITTNASHEGGDRQACNDVTHQATLEDASHELTVTPHYSECNGRTIELNGCHFVFKTSGTEKVISEEKSEVPGTADVVCPDEQQITIIGPFGTCEVHIPAQTGLQGVTFTNITPAEGKKYVTVDVSITTELEYEETDVGTFCAYTEGHTAEDGNLVRTVKMEGFEDGEPTSHETTEGVETYGTGAATDIDVK